MSEMKRKPNKRMLYIKKSYTYYFSNQNMFTPFLYTPLELRYIFDKIYLNQITKIFKSGKLG